MSHSLLKNQIWTSLLSCFSRLDDLPKLLFRSCQVSDDYYRERGSQGDNHRAVPPKKFVHNKINLESSEKKGSNDDDHFIIHLENLAELL